MRLERRNEPIEESARAIEAGKKEDCWYLTHMTPSQLTLRITYGSARRLRFLQAT